MDEEVQIVVLDKRRILLHGKVAMYITPMYIE